MCFEFDFAIVSDGGTFDPGAGNHGYGSYQLSNRDGRKQTVHLDLGTATNNEAEYRTMIAVLKDLVGRIQRAGEGPSDISLLVHTDSQLLVGQCTQGWQVKAAKAGSQRASYIMRAAIWGIAIQACLPHARAICTKRAMAGLGTRDSGVAPGSRSA